MIRWFGSPRIKRFPLFCNWVWIRGFCCAVAMTSTATYLVYHAYGLAVVGAIFTLVWVIASWILDGKRSFDEDDSCAPKDDPS